MPEGKMNHAVCNSCWYKRQEKRAPFRVSFSLENCCFCGEITDSGIFIRAYPASVPCNGEHDNATD